MAMSTWIAVKQALMVLDAVERTWGREVGLDGSQVTLFLLLSRLPGRSASDLALYTGRHRQHVWRSMTALKQRGLVHPSRASERGTEAWSLAPAGVAIAQALERRLAAWEGLMGRHVDLDEVFRSLQRMVTTVVNRPSAKGWRRGLLAPEESWMDPDWNAHLHSAVLPEASPPDERASGSTEQRSRDPKTPADYDRIERAWNKIWNG